MGRSRFSDSNVPLGERSHLELPANERAPPLSAEPISRINALTSTLEAPSLQPSRVSDNS
jgi:hypothetical protein